MRGFNVSSPREQNDAVMKGKAFYYDHIHPDGNTGHRQVDSKTLCSLHYWNERTCARLYEQLV